MIKRIENEMQEIPLFETRQQARAARIKALRLRDAERMRLRAIYYQNESLRRLEAERLQRKMNRMPSLIAGLR